MKTTSTKRRTRMMKTKTSGTRMFARDEGREQILSALYDKGVIYRLFLESVAAKHGVNIIDPVIVVLLQNDDYFDKNPPPERFYEMLRRAHGYGIDEIVGEPAIACVVSAARLAEVADEITPHLSLLCSAIGKGLGRGGVVILAHGAFLIEGAEPFTPLEKGMTPFVTAGGTA